ncbi:hypothetical protein Tco_0018487 [Tanacetum coccineum]
MWWRNTKGLVQSIGLDEDLNGVECIAKMEFITQKFGQSVVWNVDEKLWMFSKNMPIETGKKRAIRQWTIDTIFDIFNRVSYVIGKIELLTCFEIIEHDRRACIYGISMNINTNDILTKNKFPIFDVGIEIIIVSDA